MLPSAVKLVLVLVIVLYLWDAAAQSSTSSTDSASSSSFDNGASYDTSADQTCFTKSFDFIVVGSGAAGSVVATRLSEKPGVKVLVLEAGTPSQRATGSRDGGTFKYKQDANGQFHDDGSYTRYDVPLLWFSTYQSGLIANESGEWIIGGTPGIQAAKKIGGSHAHNGMNWLRSTPSQIDSWNITGWKYTDLLPYYIKSENVSSYRVSPGDPYHGFSGPIQISDQAVQDMESSVICNATVNAGYRYALDFNGNPSNVVEGCQWAYQNIRRGVRDSTAVAYLFKNIARPNLYVRANAQVTKIIFNLAGKATGVQVTDLNDGTSYNIGATKAVILAAGTLNTPKLLITSGIGPADELAALGITPVVVNNNVGRNIRNQPRVITSWVASNETHPNYYDHWIQAVQYAKFGTGFLSSTGQGLNILLKSNSSLNYTDLLYNVNSPVSSSLYANIVNVGVIPSRPAFAGGYITVNTSNGLDDNLSYYQNFTSYPEDINTIVQGIKLLRRIMSFAPANSYFAYESVPGAAYVTDAQLTAWVIANSAGVFHYNGSTKMGNTGDPKRVVDNHLRVQGVTGLLVVDASIMPGVHSGLPQAVIIAMAEKAADVIKADFSL